MKKLWMILGTFFFLAGANAQTKPVVKKETTKPATKNPVVPDSTKAKAPSNVTRQRYDESPKETKKKEM